MIFKPRVAPMYANASAANGIVAAAHRNGATALSPVLNVSASHGASAKLAAENGSDTSSAMVPLRRTSPRTRPASSRPTRIAIRRMLATSIPNRVAAAAMKANCVVSVTTP
jgi:hypothetical protein